MNSRFWNWEPSAPSTHDDPASGTGRVLRINGVIAEESWFDDDITPALFATELNAGSGDVTVWLNSPGGDVVAAAQIEVSQVLFRLSRWENLEHAKKI